MSIGNAYRRIAPVLTILTLCAASHPGNAAPTDPRLADPRVATLMAKVRQVEWTPERFLIVDALLEDLRQRSRRIPVEQAALPGMSEL
jgi:hypothetical protein